MRGRESINATPELSRGNRLAAKQGTERFRNAAEFAVLTEIILFNEYSNLMNIQ